MPTLINKNTENGKLYFGDKDAEYLKTLSRQAVEEHHNAPILFFEIDWAKSKRNFYGEMLIKKFKQPKGIKIKGSFKISQGTETAMQGIPNKIMTLIVSVYVEQLKELDVQPDLGDYFGIGKRLYSIYDKTIEDVGPGSLMMNRGRVRQDFMCVAEDDEVLAKNAFGDNLGLEADIDPENSDID